MKTEKDFSEYLNKMQKAAQEEGYDSLDETYVAHLRARFFGENVIIGESDRIVLREMKPSDMARLYQFEDVKSEPVLRPFIKNTPKESEENLEAYIAEMYPFYDYGIWAAELKATGEMIGMCGLGQIEVDRGICPDMGYYICPKWRRQGLATECIKIALDYAKTYLELSELYAVVDASNQISKTILKKFGFLQVEQASDADTLKFCCKLKE